MNEKKEIMGVIYALPQKLAERIFEKNKNIFVKFMTHNTKNIKLEEKDKLLIYLSNSNKKIMGEATIKKIEFLYVKELKKKYLGEVFINNKELNFYTKGRENKLLMVLRLEKIKKYPQEKYVSYPISMSGKYITRKDYKKIIGRSK
jgi:hypothetical protein